MFKLTKFDNVMNCSNLNLLALKIQPLNAAQLDQLRNVSSNQVIMLEIVLVLFRKIRSMSQNVYILIYLILAGMFLKHI